MEWLLDIYHSIGNVSPCIVCIFNQKNLRNKLYLCLSIPTPRVPLFYYIYGANEFNFARSCTHDENTLVKQVHFRSPFWYQLPATKQRNKSNPFMPSIPYKGKRWRPRSVLECCIQSKHGCNMSKVFARACRMDGWMDGWMDGSLIDR